MHCQIRAVAENLVAEQARNPDHWLIVPCLTRDLANQVWQCLPPGSKIKPISAEGGPYQGNGVFYGWEK